MNPKIHKIIDNMKKHTPADDNLPTPHVLQNYLSVQMARLLVLLAEETESQNQKIFLFTKVLLWFTAALIFIGIIQITAMILKS